MQQKFSYATILVALRQMLPTAGQTLLLRACLDADQGVAAWSTWGAMHDLKETLAGDNAGVKGLLPLLAFALEQNEAKIDADDLSLLRMARFRESLRFERYQGILQQALVALAEGGVKAILLKGAALALTLYPQPELRHNHDIDLLIQPNDLTLAAKVLLAHGFAQDSQRPISTPIQKQGDLRLDHSSGLPVVLHTSLARNYFFSAPLDRAWQSALPLGGRHSTLMLAPEWELVHIIGVMLCMTSRARVTWVCDAHFLLAANPGLDWELVCEIAIESHLAMPAFVMLGYLQQQHRSPIPTSVFTRLQQSFASAGRAGYEQLLQCAYVQNGAGYGELLAAASNWQERLFLWRWMLFPLPTTLQRQVAPGIRSWQLSSFYLRRGLRYLVRQATSAKLSSKHTHGKYKQGEFRDVQKRVS